MAPTAPTISPSAGGSCSTSLSVASAIASDSSAAAASGTSAIRVKLASIATSRTRRQDRKGREKLSHEDYRFRASLSPKLGRAHHLRGCVRLDMLLAQKLDQRPELGRHALAVGEIERQAGAGRAPIAEDADQPAFIEEALD